MLLQFFMAAGAAVARPGVLADVTDRAQVVARNDLDEMLFRDLQTAADDFAGTSVAVLGGTGGGHRRNHIRREDGGVFLIEIPSQFNFTWITPPVKPLCF